MDEHQYSVEYAALVDKMMAHGLNLKQAHGLAYYAYEKGHAYGYEEVINILTSLAEAVCR